MSHARRALITGSGEMHVLSDRNHHLTCVHKSREPDFQSTDHMVCESERSAHQRMDLPSPGVRGEVDPGRNAASPPDEQRVTDAEYARQNPLMHPFGLMIFQLPVL